MIDHDLDTFGKILTAMLSDVRLDPVTGKATRLWNREALREHLRVDAATFSAWITGRRIPPIGSLRTMIGVVEEAGTPGTPYIEALKRICAKVCQADEEPRVGYARIVRLRKPTV
jgi:hypothetical protein